MRRVHSRQQIFDRGRCVGACGLAPVMIVDGEVYGKLKPDDVEHILDKYMRD